jgi:hypothetical protein
MIVLLMVRRHATTTRPAHRTLLVHLGLALLAPLVARHSCAGGRGWPAGAIQAEHSITRSRTESE